MATSTVIPDMTALVNYSRKYIVDWLVIVAMQLYTVLIAIHTQPFLKKFNPLDPSINFPLTEHEQVSTTQCIFIAALIPCAIISIKFFCIDLKFRLKELLKLDKFHQLHLAILGLIYSVSISGVIVTVLKNWIGRPRPDFISRCIPDVSRISSSTLLFDVSICTGDYDIIMEGLRSHPSGHSAVSFTGLTFLTFWLYNQLTNNSTRALEIWKLLILLIPDFIALWTGITRIQDYRHHYTDVISGAIIGIGVSSVVYHRIFSGRKPVYLDENLSESTTSLLPLYNSQA